MTEGSSCHEAISGRPVVEVGVESDGAAMRPSPEVGWWARLAVAVGR